MYKEMLRAIDGIGLFPVVSLLLFVTVFTVALVRVLRMDRADARTAGLAAARRRRDGVHRAGGSPMSARGDDPNRDELLDHEADGIREFDNALPRWWLYGFYLTIVFAAVYVVNYHVLATPLFGRPGMVAEYRPKSRLRRGSRPRRPAAPPSRSSRCATSPAWRRVAASSKAPTTCARPATGPISAARSGRT